MKSRKPTIFTKARIANIMSAYVIIFGLYVLITQQVPVEVVGIIAGMMGFAAKHLWDNCASNSE